MRSAPVSLSKKEDYEGWYGQYIKYGKRKAMEIATLGCAVRVKLSADKKTIEDVRLGYGVAGPTPLRCHAAEEYLRGKAVSDKEAAAEFANAGAHRSKSKIFLESF